MEKHVIKTNQTESIWVDEGDSEWLLKKGVKLIADEGFVNPSFDDVTFTIEGKIVVDGDGILATPNAPGTSTDNTIVKVAASGRILSGDDGVILRGTGVEVQNAGVIRSEGGKAVRLQSGDIRIENRGTMVSEDSDAVNITDSTGFHLRNDGRVAALNEDDGAITAFTSGEGKVVNGAKGMIEGMLFFSGGDGDVTVVNHGRMTGSMIGSNENALHFGSGEDHLVNRGTISGIIALGDGDDVADLRKGKLLKAHVQGYDGDDLFIVDKANIDIWEKAGEGNDTIKTTVSYKLGDAADGFIETLTAIGKESIKLTGNSQANILNGNSANNKLAGGGGNDTLLGFGGNDVLTGGDGADHFYFYTKGGTDKVTDFTIDVDTIHILQIPGIGDFDDLQDHMKVVDADGDGEKDDDTIIDLGDGKIRLVGVDKNALDMDDFSIFA